MCDATTSYIWHDSFICETWLSCVTHTCVPQTYVKHMNVSYHTHECVTSHLWMRHVTHMNASRHTYECVTSHIWMRHVTHMNESRHTYDCVTSHLWLRLITRMNASYHTYEWVMSHTWMSMCAGERERERERESERARMREWGSGWVSDWVTERVCAGEWYVRHDCVTGHSVTLSTMCRTISTIYITISTSTA